MFLPYALDSPSPKEMRVAERVPLALRRPANLVEMCQSAFAQA